MSSLAEVKSAQLYGGK